MKEEFNIEMNYLDYLEGRMRDSERKMFEEMMAQDTSLKSSFVSYENVWKLMNEAHVPKPSTNMKQNFYQMLAEEKSKLRTSSKSSGYINRLAELYHQFINSRLATSAMLVVLYTSIGYMIAMSKIGQNKPNDQVSHLSEEVRQMKEMMTVAMRENPLATERMKAVSYTEALPDHDDKVITALLSTFKLDENENVRLVALEALVKIADKPKVREALIEALVNEKSPLIQVALADAMVKMHEKTSVVKMKEILKENQLNKYVKDKLQKSIETLSI
jgi:hypothetical protein